MAGRVRKSQKHDKHDHSDDDGESSSENNPKENENAPGHKKEKETVSKATANTHQDTHKETHVHVTQDGDFLKKQAAHAAAVAQSQQQTIAQSQLGQQLQQIYGKSENKELYYIKKTRMFMHKSELKRICLAFQSRMTDELNYALNSLLLFSVNQVDPFMIDSNTQILEYMTRFLEDSIRNIPSMQTALNLRQIVPRQSSSAASHSQINYQDDGQGAFFSSRGDRETTELIKSLNIIENYNYKVSDILIFQQKKGIEISPIELLKKRRKEYISQVYDVVAEINLLEQVRTVFQILRNLSYTKHNETQIAKDERLSHLVLQLYIHNCDSEISKSAIDIISNISKHIQLPLIPEYELFCKRLFQGLQSDNNEELESVVRINYLN